ncbi:MAG: methyltransferase domain-containing protein [Alphaproteobacteria bacterium]|nr:methyltransferase domain-containing protein [Alphaproteobacteria bacterium]
MAEGMQVFDRRLVRRHRDRAATAVPEAADLLREAAERLVERLDDVTRRFSRALDLGGRGIVAPMLRGRGIATVAFDLSARLAALSGPPCVSGDEEWLPFAPASFHLIVASLSLHWINDLPGALVQLRRALVPDGLLLASVPVVGSLGELRAALTEAEAALTGGAAPRVSPFPELAECAALLQRAGFALPVVELEELTLRYAEPLRLLRDLRAAGETNALAARDRRTPPRALFPLALGAMPRGEDGRIPVTLRLAMMSGWAPAPAQPQPLARGSAQVSLAEAFRARDPENTQDGEPRS